ncbi:hypothetical protein FRC03_004214 [Tulasnella sp. 419]|nr:hypothetical protein FRC03_004214 [Tulasnella sp. 419]
MATSPATSEETRPLLSSSSPENYQATSLHQATSQSADVEASMVPPAPKVVETKWNLAKILWRTVYAIVAGVILGVFIKGWIDADDVEFDLKGALKKALGGGLSGAAAMVLQVATLMPLRTVMNYQYRYGTSTKQAIITLWNDGGYGRYYRGVGAALIQGPAARFGDTAANAGILALLQSNPYLRRLPVLIQTIFASFAAACFRMILTPIDTLKTTLQTEGDAARTIISQDGLRGLFGRGLKTRILTNGLQGLMFSILWKLFLDLWDSKTKA